MNQVLNNLETLCLEQNFPTQDIENLKKYLNYVLHFLPIDSLTRQEAFVHEDSRYYVFSFPMEDIFENPWNERNVKLSASLKILASKFNMTARFQDHGSFSGLTLRFKF
jgi:hypothetical protein